jgi:hypothetical protein
MLSKDKIEVLLRDTNEISRLIRKWQSQQTEEAAKAPWTREDKLRKSISDLIDSEVDYVRVCCGEELGEGLGEGLGVEGLGRVLCNY